MARYVDVEKAERYFENHRRIAIHKDDIVAYLSTLPAVNVKRVELGAWVDDGYGSYIKICSLCSKEPLATPHGDPCYSKYCPHCGAKMR